MTEKRFFEILGIYPEKKKEQIQVIFKNGSSTILEYYPNIEYITEDQDCKMIISNVTGEILYIS